MFAIIVKLPAGLLVLNTPIVMLEFGIAFLARLLFLAVLIEPGDSKPSTIRTSLTGLGIESRGKGVYFGKDGAIRLQIIVRDALAIHPQTQTFVANELHHAADLVDGSILFVIAIHLVLVDQHERGTPPV